ncbi:MAG: hypothetical protein ABSA44_10900 [Bacteroidota bacterium]|jgi:hypothetical protein
MNTIKRLFQEAKAVIKRFRTAFLLASMMTRSVQVSMLILIFLSHVAISQKIDTSEQAMVNNFQKLMRNSETIVDAQVISKESKWDSINGSKFICTLIKLKVFQTIKGTIENNEFTFKQPGGTGANTTYMVGAPAIYSLNERAIFFFSKKDINAYLQEESRVQIWRGGTVLIGNYRIDTNEYINTVKQTVADTTVFPKYLHRLKMSEEEYKTRSLRSKNNQMTKKGIIDTVKQENHSKQGNSNTTEEGVK